MYLPVNTYLTNSEKVNKNDGERLILTFDGDNPFMLIEETLSYEEEHLIVPTYGELELMASTVAIVNENSVNWIDNNMEYYVVSDSLSKGELLEIARSIKIENIKDFNIDETIACGQIFRYKKDGQLIRLFILIFCSKV